MIKKHPRLKTLVMVASTNPDGFISNNHRFLSKHIDQLLFSNKRAFDDYIDDKEKSTKGRELLISHSSIDAYIVPIGGQGVLTFNLDNAPKTTNDLNLFSKSDHQSITSIIATDQNNALSMFKKSMSHFSDHKIIKNTWKIVWLTRDIFKTNSFIPLEKSYKNYHLDQFKLRSTQKIKEIPTSKYIGSHGCAGCHQNAYQSWINSKHASAYQTLIDNHQQFNSECISCHVVGFDQKREKKGGFISEQITPHLKGVGCENCHGARLDHINKFHDTTSSKKSTNTHLQINKNTPKNCQTCHHPPHSISFDYQQSWKEIKHGY